MPETGATSSVQRILIPLDGSPLAELALPEAVALSRLPHTQLTLLYVIAPIEDVIAVGPQEIAIDQQWEVQRDHALRYLRGIAVRPEWGSVTINVAVEMGRPAETILAFAERSGMDRIVMSTMGEPASAVGCLGAWPTRSCVLRRRQWYWFDPWVFFRSRKVAATAIR